MAAFSDLSLHEIDIIEFALREDVGKGDITSTYFVELGLTANASVIAREACILAGIGVTAEVFHRVDPELRIKILRKDGDRLKCGDTALEVFGRAAPILTAERTALNFVQRLSGIATLTRCYVDAISGTSTVLLDTRKTTPGLRKLEKAAVVAGGGRNHRFGLFDRVLVKDNHLMVISNEALVRAIDRVRKEQPEVGVELEADSLDQVRRFAGLEGVEQILLDNMSPEQIRHALTFRRPGLTFEASGNIHLKNIREFAETGIDYISIGALTHSARAMDFALDFRS